MIQNLVTIAIPVYNREKYIAEAIFSALNQTHKNIEVIVVDNNSTDSTWDIISEISKNNKLVKIYKNDSNIGPINNWIKAINLSTGNYINLLFSDDLISPLFIEKLLPPLANFDVGFSFSAATIFNDGDLPLNGMSWYDELQTGYYSCLEFIDYSLLNSPGKKLSNSPACALFRRADILKNLYAHIPNKINSDFSMHAIGNDLLIFLLTALDYKLFYIENSPLTHFRAHSGSITVKSNPFILNLYYTITKSYFFKNHLKSPTDSKFNDFLVQLVESKNYAPYGINTTDDFFDN
jgi:glycosyltransferase involved in cell wall biosynthesis